MPIHKAFVPYFGSKRNTILSAQIEQYLGSLNGLDQIYVEPFVGAGAMFFSIDCRSAVLNDKWDLLYNFWKVVQTNCEGLEKELEFAWAGKPWFDEYQKRTDPLGKAVFFYLAQTISYGHTNDPEFIYKYRIHGLRKTFGPWKKKMDELASLTIWNLDFREVYAQLWKSGRESPRTRFYWYVDPPYVAEEGYQFSFKEQDHRDLAEWNGKVGSMANTTLFLSYDDRPLVKELYPSSKGWYMKPVVYNVKGGHAGEKDYQELLISNRPFASIPVNNSKKPFQTNNQNYKYKNKNARNKPYRHY